MDAACSATPFVYSAVSCTSRAVSGVVCCASARAAVVVAPASRAPPGKCGWACTRTYNCQPGSRVREGVRTMGDLGDEGGEGGLLCGELCLCGVVTDFLSELSGRGFGLDDSSGSLVSVRGNEYEVTRRRKEQSVHSDITYRAPSISWRGKY